MPHAKSNIILIGMAGSGKSSIGRMVAEKLHRPFTDTDDLIAQRAGCTLQEIIDNRGGSGFRLIEESVLLDLTVTGYVISTGGSSIYSRRGMEHLKKDGVIIHLDVELSVLQQRIKNMDSRGLVKEPQQSFAELYEERLPLYYEYADISLACSGWERMKVRNAIIKICVNNGVISQPDQE